MREESRFRISLLDVMIAVSVILLLMGLLLPATSFYRIETRGESCQNNAKQLALATLNQMMTSRQDSFPGYLDVQKVAPNSSWQDEYPNTPESEITVAWAGRLLPQLDEHATWEQLVANKPAAGGQCTRLHAIKIFLCPNDPQVDADYPALSYVVNSGMPDLPNPSATTPSDLAANGVCHDLRPNRWGPRVQRVSIGDGLSHTFLLAENIHRDYPARAHSPENTWWQPAPGIINVEQWYGMTWVYDPADPLHPSTTLFEQINRDTRNDADRQRPYRDFGSRFARPASSHPGVFVAAFCEGYARYLSVDIDYRVYQQLMTPNGMKAADPDNPSVLIEQVLQQQYRGFMNPPLKDSDYLY